MRPQKRVGCMDLSTCEEPLTPREKKSLCQRCKRPWAAVRIQSPINFPDNQQRLLVCSSCADEANRLMHEHYTVGLSQTVESKQKTKKSLRELIIVILVESVIASGIATLLYRDIALSHITLQNIITSTRTVPYAFLMFTFIIVLLTGYTKLFQGLINQGQWWYEKQLFNMRMRKWMMMKGRTTKCHTEYLLMQTL